jgi:hypothetical protein
MSAQTLLRDSARSAAAAAFLFDAVPGVCKGPHNRTLPGAVSEPTSAQLSRASLSMAEQAIFLDEHRQIEVVRFRGPRSPTAESDDAHGSCGETTVALLARHVWLQVSQSQVSHSQAHNHCVVVSELEVVIS